MGFLRHPIAIFTSAAVATICITPITSVSNLFWLISADMPVTLWTWLSMIFQDFFNLGIPLLLVFAIGFSIAFAVARLLIILFKLPPKFMYGLAAATAIATALFLMVELIDTHFESAPTAADLVMNNSAAKHYLKGPRIPLSAVKAASLKFLKDDEWLLSEPEEDWLSPHMETLSWMIDQALSLGFSLTADHVWMTGAMGPIHPLKPGRYQYSLGGESSLTFSVT
jgi:hypothetical protein